MNDAYTKKQKIVKASKDRRKAAGVEKGLVMVFTGNGKGKSTAAFGMALRMLHHGGKVGVVQFIKGKIETGEQALLQKLGVDWRRSGEGFSWETQDKAVDAAAAAQGLKMAAAMTGNEDYAMVILDEINVALKREQVSLEQVLHIIRNKPAAQHLVLTGRGASEGLLKFADTVTEMKSVKHHLAAGVVAQKGIEL